MIPYGRQHITDDDVAAVEAVLRSDFLTQGPAVPAFEKALADYCGADHAVAVNSATSALHIACLALGVTEGDVVWTTPNTFVASANCARYCGAMVDFVDIDPETFNMCADALAAKLAVADALPKVVIPVHFSGHSCDMAAIAALAEQYGFKVIEDASHAVGGRYRDQPVGNCAYSDITVFSFHPVKIITSAEGGVALTNDAGLQRKMDRLRSHGVTRNPDDLTNLDAGPWHYEMLELGLNYRMTDMQAALGLSQMQRLDELVARRQVLADRYDVLLADLPVLRPGRAAGAYSAWHLYCIQIDERQTNHSRRQVFETLRADGIGVNVHYIPVHTQPYYRGQGFKPGDFPLSEAYYKNAITIPLYATMSNAQQDEVVAALKRALGVA
ncbi:MAG: UDP-4-amino-4,6-dideoxy-N-acetyl-beta-L-altrosamine transaminase [Alphaproteobacteria bacterium]|jgi:UDP-4-amino-4,6-dideoxy-N-acetyl-beta-L-altrosamine transaminase|nr:UDP-4-amino-4,6-dideoxy-N-acetyl-beta-L-altrosamine transaminase [Alphaproteobacteria bacterium]